MDEPLQESPAIFLPAYAGFWIRVGAELLDEVLILLICCAIGLAIIIPTLVMVDMAGRELDTETYVNIVVPLIFLPVLWLYRAGFEASRKQATPGKLAMGLKVTDEQGNRMSFGRATVRSLAKIISGVFGNLGFILVGLTKRKQGLHDMLAKTLVVRTR